MKKIFITFLVVIFSFVTNAWSDSEVKKKYYWNDQLKSSVTYVNGKKHGSALYFHRNGNLNQKEYWLKGCEEGTWHSYYRNGRLSAIHVFSRGVVIKYSVFNKKGKVTESEDFRFMRDRLVQLNGCR
jgi:antitoxin component YwqK of YwqJK toxin-antitoxin module